MPDLASLLERIAILVGEQPAGGPARLLEVMEHTLTDGYAHALTLEGEGIRIAREIDAAVAVMNGGAPVPDLAALTDRRGEIERDVSTLRSHLATLRQKTESVRHSSLAA